MSSPFHDCYALRVEVTKFIEDMAIQTEYIDGIGRDLLEEPSLDVERDDEMDRTDRIEEDDNDGEGGDEIIQHEGEYQEQEQPSQTYESIGRFNVPAKALLARFERVFRKTMGKTGPPLWSPESMASIMAHYNLMGIERETRHELQNMLYFKISPRSYKCYEWMLTLQRNKQLRSAIRRRVLWLHNEYPFSNKFEGFLQYNYATWDRKPADPRHQWLCDPKRFLSLEWSFLAYYAGMLTQWGVYCIDWLGMLLDQIRKYSSEFVVPSPSLARYYAAEVTAEEAIGDGQLECPIDRLGSWTCDERPLAVLPCGHVFCSTSLDIYFAAKEEELPDPPAPRGLPTCPYCQTRLHEKVDVKLNRFQPEEVSQHVWKYLRSMDNAANRPDQDFGDELANEFLRKFQGDDRNSSYGPEVGRMLEALTLACPESLSSNTIVLRLVTTTAN